MEKQREIITNRIREELARRNMTKSEYAKLLGLSKAYVGQIVNGKVGLSIEKADEMLAPFGLEARVTVEIVQKKQLAR